MTPLADFDFWLGVAGLAAGIAALACEVESWFAGRREERRWWSVDDQGRRIW